MTSPSERSWKAEAAGSLNAIVRAAQRALHDPRALRLPLASIARSVGYHPDYLNRALKQACGLTLGEMRDEARMQRSRQLLASTVPIAAVAEGVGFDDPNYFTRWFKTQTSRTPSAWRTGTRTIPPHVNSKNW